MKALLTACNVGTNNENDRVRELAEIVDRDLSWLRVKYAEGAGHDPRSYRDGFSKLAKTLRDPTPSWTARDGARSWSMPSGWWFSRPGASIRSRDPRGSSRDVDAGSPDDELRWSHGREAADHPAVLGSCPNESS